MKAHPLTLGLKACWQKQKLSDISVLIFEKGSRRKDPDEVQPKQQESRLSGREEAKHIVLCSKAVLAAQAEYFRTRLLSDLDDGAGDVSIIVEEGEADAALAVIQSMYTGIADDVPTAELVTMWKIADMLQAASTAAMCVEALCAKGWDWDAALLVSREQEGSSHPHGACKMQRLRAYLYICIKW
jgi:hypothetical protein